MDESAADTPDKSRPPEFCLHGASASRAKHHHDGIFHDPDQQDKPMSARRSARAADQQRQNRSHPADGSVDRIVIDGYSSHREPEQCDAGHQSAKISSDSLAVEAF
jgi:hypothetical protein